MAFAEAKVYFDGSHYIAIPHTTRPGIKKAKPKEEEIIILQEDDSIQDFVDESSSDAIEIENQEDTEIKKPKLKAVAITKKELFEKLYNKYLDKKKAERKALIVKEMLPHFGSKIECLDYVETNLERKLRNLISRRIRMSRKANLANFNYFCTFTYDDKLHTEDTFKKKLKNILSLFSSRRCWKYMGVWERAPKTNRLHFHGLFYIPDGSLPGTLEEHIDYNTKLCRRTKTIQSSYFNKRFGRSDFEKIDTHQDLMQEVSYIMKYIEKTEEKIVYSKGLYQYFVSDILDDDVVCRIGLEDKKLLLFDNFICMNEGEVIGVVSPETIQQLRKTN